MSKERLTAEAWLKKHAAIYVDDEIEACYMITDVLTAMRAFAAQEVEAAIADVTKQRDELLEALKELVHLHGCEQEGIGSGQPTPEQWYKAVDKASLAITNAQEK
jgi:hypothetical protein